MHPGSAWGSFVPDSVSFVLGLVLCCRTFPECLVIIILSSSRIAWEQVAQRAAAKKVACYWIGQRMPWFLDTCRTRRQQHRPKFWKILRVVEDPRFRYIGAKAPRLHHCDEAHGPLDRVGEGMEMDGPTSPGSA